jgi:hypothetical protein
MPTRARSAIVAGTVAGLLALGTAASAHPPSHSAAGVVAVVVHVEDSLNDLQLLSHIGSIEIITVKDSLNNVLNNSPILSNNVITVQDILQNCNVVSCIELRNFLNNNNILITDVVAIDVLSGGDITIFLSPSG